MSGERVDRYVAAIENGDVPLSDDEALLLAPAVMAVADAELAELRAEVQKMGRIIITDWARFAALRDLADAWGEWPITAQGQAADMLREFRAALGGDE